MRGIFSIITAATFLLYSTGIVGASPFPGLPAKGALMPFSQQPDSRKSEQYGVLYTFGPGANGENPEADLVYANGVFYGTTSHGGTHDQGTVFEVTLGGTERVLYSFAGGADGANPQAGLVYENGVFYGTTFSGGTYGDGTVFEVTTGGTESVLHSFGSGTDGANPIGGLAYANGVFYGTTPGGGQYGYGAVFEMNAGGAESVLHSFTDMDGAYPSAGLIYANGMLYGTTSAGGKHSLGTAFEMTASGTERVLHSFNYNGGDGVNPYGALVYHKGNLYGTTSSGGKDSGGTVFAIAADGTESVLHSFALKGDGRFPYAGLFYANGNLYGTTVNGGKYTDGEHAGYGTVFKVTLSGTESVLHSFGSKEDGQNPFGSLVYENGLLYGTTAAGGKYGAGIVFELSP